jgi:molecular chaperone GrpE
MSDVEQAAPEQARDAHPGGAGTDASEAGTYTPGTDPGGADGVRVDVPEAPRPEAGQPDEEAREIEAPEAGQPDEEAREVEGDLDELVATAAQRDEYLALAQRTQADFENYRKRISREAAAAAERGVAKLAKELLPALDNLDRALESAEEADPLLEGVRLVRAELAAALARVGIESFDPAGEQFDPAFHEAMAQQPVEGAESGTVVEVFQPGYRLNGTMIRPARVVVAR